MTQKELLYIEDMLSHLEYSTQHLIVTEEKLEDVQMAKLVRQLIKKNKDIYSKFYQLF